MSQPDKTYLIGPEVEVEVWKKAAARRRKALVAHGCSTYVIGVRGGQPGIACMCCGLGSSHPDDIAHKFCGFCNAFHSEEIPE